jgi:hypothetical protein
VQNLVEILEVIRRSNRQIGREPPSCGPLHTVCRRMLSTDGGGGTKFTDVQITVNKVNVTFGGPNVCMFRLLN